MATPELPDRTTCFFVAHPQNREKTITDAAASDKTFLRILIEPAFPHPLHCTPVPVRGNPAGGFFREV